MEQRNIIPYRNTRDDSEPSSEKLETLFRTLEEYKRAWEQNTLVSILKKYDCDHKVYLYQDDYRCDKCGSVWKGLHIPCLSEPTFFRDIALFKHDRRKVLKIPKEYSYISVDVGYIAVFLNPNIRVSLMYNYDKGFMQNLKETSGIIIAGNPAIMQYVDDNTYEIYINS